MARYNTSQATTSVNGTTTISSPYSGAFTELTGTAPYTVTLPTPVLYPGSNQTFYNATSGTVTLSTPSGIFSGLGSSGTNTFTLPTNTVTSITSDGTNYVVLSEDGSAMIATTGSFTGNVDMSGLNATVTVNPQTLTVYPTGPSNMNNVNIGGTARGTGAFTTLAANSATTLTGNIASSNTATGTLVVTGGVGVSGSVYAAGFNGSLTGTIQTSAQSNITSVGSSLGVGIASAATTLHVDSTSNTTLRLTDRAVNTSGNYGGYISGYSVASSGGRLSLGVVDGGTNNEVISSTAQGTSLSLKTNNGANGSTATRLHINNSGFVGLNTTDPVAGLHIQTSTKSLSLASPASGGGGASYIIMGNNDSAGTAGPSLIVAANRELYFGVGNSFSDATGGTLTTRLFINSSGYIGANTTNFSAGYTFNVAHRFRANGTMLGNGDGSNAADDRIRLDWSSGTDALVLAQQNVPLKLGQNNTERLRLTDSYVYAIPNRFITGAEIETASKSGGTTISGPGLKELFRMGGSRLVTSGIFSLGATRGNYVTSAVYSWTTCHPGDRGTVTQLSSTNYVQHDVCIDAAGDGGVIVSIDWGQGDQSSWPMDYTVSVIKLCGSGQADFTYAGTDRASVPSGYSRIINYSSISNGFKANNGVFLGSLSKGSGSFKIDHPLPELEETHNLVHSFIEGPQADLIYRGQVELVNGRAEINIDDTGRMTEGTFNVLCRNVQCFTSNETDWSPVKGKVTGNILTIECQDATSTATVSWMVVGERKDKHMYDTEWTDANGRPIVEPLKTTTLDSYPEYPDNVTVNASIDTTE